MNSLLLYIAQSSACLLLFYLFYRLVLHRERCFQYNRFYLLLTPLLSLLIPLLRIPVMVPEPVAEVAWVYALPASAAVVVEAAPEKSLLSLLHWHHALLLLYGLGVLIFLVQLFRQLHFVRTLLRAQQHLAFIWENCTVVPTRGRTPTFSFLRYIFWDDAQPVSETEKRQILQHERVHIRQRHSLDLLYLRGLHTILWFNPLLLLYQKALVDTHEYIADEQVVRTAGMQDYTSLVVRQLFRKMENPIGHFFSKSKTLNRIAMMNRKAQPKRWKLLLVLPLLALSVALFSFQLSPLLNEEGLSVSLSSEAGLPATQTRTITGIVTSATTKAGLAGVTIVAKGTYRGTTTDLSGKFSFQIPANVTTLIFSYIGLATLEKEIGTSTNLQVALQPDAHKLSELKVVPNAEDREQPTVGSRQFSAPTGLQSGDSQKKNTVYTFIEQMPVFRGGDAEMMQYLNQNIKYPEAARKAGIEGLVVLSFRIEANGTVSDIEVIKKLSPELDQEAVRVAKTMSGQWNPGMQDGKPVPFKFTLPIRFSLGQPARPSTEQASSPEVSPPNKPFTYVEQMPQFEGGDMEMMKYLGRSIKYPAPARKAGLKGLVVTEFTVEVNGTLSDVKVLKGLSPEIDEEAVQVVKSMSGKWKPGMQNGTPVPVKFTLPIRFDLDQPEEPVKQEETPLSRQEAPRFLGGPDELNRHIRQSIKFASPTSQRPVDGIVTISVVVNPDGTLVQVKMVDRKFKNIKVIGESSMDYMDAEKFDGGQRKMLEDLSLQALNAVRATSGKWSPGVKNGRAEKSSLTLQIPIKFP